MALFSIIINNYNYARFLPCAIESALAQTYSDLEIIVVDDGSKDDSASLIKTFGTRIRSIIKPNGGQASALNAGFAESHGKYVLFLDSDDVLLPDAVERIIGKFLEQPYTKVAAPLLIIDQTGHFNGFQTPKGDLPSGDLRDLAILRGPSSHLVTPTSGNAWSREYLERIFPIPEEPFRLYADAYLTDLSVLMGPISALPDPVGFYRFHGSNGYANSKLTLATLQRLLDLYDIRCDFLASRIGDTQAIHKDQWKRNERYVMLAYLRWRLFGLKWKDWNIFSFILHSIQSLNPTRRIKIPVKYFLMHFGPRKFLDHAVEKMFDPGVVPTKQPVEQLNDADLGLSRYLVTSS